MVEENEVSLHIDEELNHSIQTVGEKRDNGFLETSSSNQSMCISSFVTPSIASTTFIVYVYLMYVDGDLGRHPQAAVFVDTSTAHSVGVHLILHIIL
jgi:hypothetical protein